MKVNRCSHKDLRLIPSCPEDPELKMYKCEICGWVTFIAAPPKRWLTYVVPNTTWNQNTQRRELPTVGW
jgi:rubredoxin